MKKTTKTIFFVYYMNYNECFLLKLEITNCKLFISKCIHFEILFLYDEFIIKCISKIRIFLLKYFI